MLLLLALFHLPLFLPLPPPIVYLGQLLPVPPSLPLLWSHLLLLMWILSPNCLSLLRPPLLSLANVCTLVPLVMLCLPSALALPHPAWILVTLRSCSFVRQLS